MASCDHMAGKSEAVFQGPVMTTAEAAAYLRICRRTLQRWTARGLVKRYDLRLDARSRRPLWRYRREDLDRLLLQGSPNRPASGLGHVPEGGALRSCEPGQPVP